MTKKQLQRDELLAGETATENFSRRNFLGFLGGASVLGYLGGAALLTGTASCKKDDVVDNGTDLGGGDVGILNYAYALEQLEAAFYIKVAMSPYTGITATEQAYLNDIRDHEIAHREFFKAALGTNAIGNLEVDFSTINFSSRDSVLGTAKAFEDLGVTAYNGAGKLIATPAYLVAAGKIVSVEARHAALIRDLISNGSFADTTNAMGLDMARTPAEVLAIAAPYIKTKINASNLPTS